MSKPIELNTIIDDYQRDIEAWEIIRDTYTSFTSPNKDAMVAANVTLRKLRRYKASIEAMHGIIRVSRDKT